MRYFLLLVFSLIFQGNIFAQRDTTIQNWTFGAEKGLAQIGGEVEAKSGFAFGFFAEKHINALFSGRLFFGMGAMQGLDLKPSTNWINNPVWNGGLNSNINYNNAFTNVIYNNFETKYMEGSLQGIFNFTQLSFFNNQSQFDGFLLGGIGAMQYETLVDAADLNGDIYDFSTLDPANEDKLQVNLTALLDGKYETPIHKDPQFIPLYHAGAGIKWNFKKNLSLTLSHRISWTGKDDLDASQWNENNVLDNTNDLFHFTSVSLTYTIFKTKTIDIPKTVIEIPVQEELEPEPEIIEPVEEEKKEEIVLTDEEEEVVKQAFDNLEFETNKAKITFKSFSSLNELGRLLNDHPTWRLTIKGHTDNVGDDQNNMKLSKDRAEAVADYLSNRGIDRNRLIVSWYGETQPIADNDTKEGRQKNRRVELEIVE